MQNTPEKIPHDADAVREVVRASYGRVAEQSESCCAPSCCTPGDEQRADRSHSETAERIGYSADEIEATPEGANLGLGCGNPIALASLSEGEVVLDLGAGAGFDALLAARAVGPTGRVIGVDMTPQMLTRARENAVKMGVADRVEFREGIIEKLPVIDESIDVIISNCVVNLSPDKAQVFREAYRVLKPGGRLAVSDVVLSEALPESVRELAAGYVACLSGALTEESYIGAIEAAGFEKITWERTPAAAIMGDCLSSDPLISEAASQLDAEALQSVTDTVFSYRIEAHKA